MFKFNIGSAVNGVNLSISSSEALAALEAEGFEGFISLRAAKSSTETTYVIKVVDCEHPAGHEEAVFAVCLRLQQDAIAYTVDGVGYLVGPKAEDWGGEFKQEYFIE